MRSKTAESAARRLRLPFAAAAALLILLLGVFAFALANSQHQQRKDINRRFEDRARVAATVNESLFSLASSTRFCPSFAPSCQRPHYLALPMALASCWARL